MQRNVEVPDSAGCLRQSQRQPVILESGSPGETSRDAQQRDWLPGRCGLLPCLYSSEQDRAAGHRKGCRFGIARSRMATGFGKSGTRRLRKRERCRAEAVMAPPPR